MTFTRKKTWGMAIKNLKVFNLALLAKCKLRMGSEAKVLWKEIIESKYSGWRNISKGIIVKCQGYRQNQEWKLVS